jgi:hypothetical protein
MEEDEECGPSVVVVVVNVADKEVMKKAGEIC